MNHIFLYFGYTLKETKYTNLAIFNYYLFSFGPHSILAIGKLQNHFIFDF